MIERELEDSVGESRGDKTDMNSGGSGGLGSCSDNELDSVCSTRRGGGGASEDTTRDP